MQFKCDIDFDGTPSGNAKGYLTAAVVAVTYAKNALQSYGDDEYNVIKMDTRRIAEMDELRKSIESIIQRWADEDGKKSLGIDVDKLLAGTKGSRDRSKIVRKILQEYGKEGISLNEATAYAVPEGLDKDMVADTLLSMTNNAEAFRTPNGKFFLIQRGEER